MNRRTFLAGLGALASAPALASNVLPSSGYVGPNVILVRFGGGVRRREVFGDKAYSPFFAKKLVPEGLLFDDMEMSDLKEVKTSHGQGTLFLLTGKYHPYEDFEDRILSERFEAVVPTLFEYLRAQWGVPSHQTLIVNNENRLQEEFYTFSNHPDFGADYRASVLSRYRLDNWRMAYKLARGGLDLKAERQMTRELRRKRALDYRIADAAQPAAIESFWEQWNDWFGETGRVEPRGDALLTELALWGMDKLRPRLMMVNYNDCDYVHWGNPAHYFRGISIMDHGLQRIVEAVQRNPYYRDNTIVVVAPDCGRDDNPLMAVPYQHHFGDRTCHEVFALFWGPGIRPGRVDRRTDQVDVAPTIAALMGLQADHTEGDVLEEVWG